MSKAKRGSAAGGERILHLDTFSGIAGNMFLGALLDAGLPRARLVEQLERLGVPFGLRVSRVKRGAIAARYLRVAGGETPIGRRTHDEIRRRIDAAGFAPPIRDRAGAMFLALARAEAKIHGVPVEKIHFHEVGAVDALVDIVGAAIAVEELEIRRITATPPSMGHGTVDTAHGTLPLPAPATLELLRGIPVTPAHIAWETVTPTGATLLRGLVDEFRELPEMVIDRIGYGAGNERDGPLPNVLRVVLGRIPYASRDRIAVIEAQLDDLQPEHYDHVLGRLLDAGALDVSLTHTIGKKNRPGFAVRVLCRPDSREAVAARLFLETSTLGLRYSESDRLVLARESRRVQTEFGKVRVKFARRPDGSVTAGAEYDDCRRLAIRHDVPIARVAQAAEQAAVASKPQGSC